FEEELRNFMGWSCEEDAATGDLSGVGFAAISIAGFLVELYVSLLIPSWHCKAFFVLSLLNRYRRPGDTVAGMAQAE
ncbi:MAG: hypothetical protein WAM53_18135, partial [Terrimicrobiaceae bacterium]